MKGVYTCNEIIAALNPTAGDTLMLLEAPSTSCLEILSASVTNVDNDTGEQLEFALYLVNTKGSPAGNALTPTPMEDGDQAAGGTFLGAGNAGLTTEPTSYDSEPIDYQGVSNLAGYVFDPIPEERPIVPPSGLIGLRMMAAPSAAFKASVNMRFRDIG